MKPFCNPTVQSTPSHPGEREPAPAANPPLKTLLGQRFHISTRPFPLKLRPLEHERQPERRAS